MCVAVPPGPVVLMSLHCAVLPGDDTSPRDRRKKEPKPLSALQSPLCSPRNPRGDWWVLTVFVSKSGAILAKG